MTVEAVDDPCPTRITVILWSESLQQDIIYRRSHMVACQMVAIGGLTDSAAGQICWLHISILQLRWWWPLSTWLTFGHLSLFMGDLHLRYDRHLTQAGLAMSLSLSPPLALLDIVIIMEWMFCSPCDLDFGPWKTVESGSPRPWLSLMSECKSWDAKLLR